MVPLKTLLGFLRCRWGGPCVPGPGPPSPLPLFLLLLPLLTNWKKPAMQRTSKMAILQFLWSPIQ